MSDIKAFFTPHGIMVGDVIDTVDQSYIIENPVVMVQNGQNTAMVPILSGVEENFLTLRERDYQFGGAFTPTSEVRNAYVSAFGGIATPPPPRLII